MIVEREHKPPDEITISAKEGLEGLILEKERRIYSLEDTIHRLKAIIVDLEHEIADVASVLLPLQEALKKL